MASTAAAFVKEDLPKPLESASEPPPLFDGTTRLYIAVSCPFAQRVWILRNYKPSIGVVLGFIGFKVILDYFGYHVSTEVSLGFVATTLSTGVLLSLLKKKSDDE